MVSAPHHKPGPRRRDATPATMTTNPTTPQIHAATIRQGMIRLTPRDQAFAESLLTQFAERGLSPSQEHWLGELARRAQPSLAPISLPNIQSMFDKARQGGLLLPRLRLDQSIRIEHWATPDGQGELRVRQGRYPAGIRLGAIRQGQFHSRPEATPAHIATLSEFDTDVAQGAKVYGRAFGHCCFCGLTLTDQPSVEAGYGPVCAGRWGLPWGQVTLPDDLLSQLDLDDQPTPTKEPPMNPGH